MERIIGKIKRRLRKLDVKGATAKVMSAVLIASSVLNALSPIAATTAYANTSSGTAYLQVGGRIDYDAFFTTHFDITADGQTNQGYCMEPSKYAAPSGTYSTGDVNSTSGRNAELRQQLWFSYGAPGFDASMWPSTWYDGTAMTAGRYKALAHILLADTYSSDFEHAVFGCSKSFRDYVSYNVLGYGNTGTDYNPNSTAHKIGARAGEVPGQDVFNVFQLNCGSNWQVILSFTYQPNGYLKLMKVSSNPSITEGNNCYSLEGAVFTVYDKDGKEVGTLTTDKNGNSNTIELQEGTYTVKETTAPEGFHKAPDQTVTIESQKTATLTFEDNPAADPIAMLVGKYDGEKTYTGSGNLPSGAASLEGAEFTVEYYDTVNYDSYDALKDAGLEPTRSWVFKTDSDGFSYFDAEHLVSGDDFYYNTNNEPTLPRGTAVIYESKAPTGYKRNEDVSFQIIQEPPTTSAVVTYNAPEVPDEVYRSDLEFTKKGDDGADRLAGVAFKLTAQSTGESHVIVTDENGFFSSASSWNKHTDNTNGNDWALEVDGAIDSSQLDMTSGIWFGGTDPDDSKGALPYDTYTIEELRCTANEGYQLIETTVIVSRDGKVYDFGTLDDIKASIVTNAYDPIDGDSYVGVGEVKVADKVTYANVIAGRDYTLVAELHDASTGKALEDADGNAITVEKTFTAQETSGSEVIELSLSTFDLGGESVVVYEYLYDSGGSLIAEHADKDDVSQQVTVIEPEIGTTATDGADGDKTVATDDEVTVTDTVAYANLIPGKEYTLKGTLHVKKTDKDGNVTEKALEVDGNPVTAETTFTPETADGTVDVTFTFDSTALKDGTQLVAFESLEHGGRELATHADIEDMGQTVTIKNPTIGTTALDGVDNDKNVVTDDETTIVDTVEYSNLVPGKEYTLTGTVQVKQFDEDGNAVAEPLEVNGETVTAQTTFTPETSDGTVNVTFTFDSRAIESGTELVAFESLARNGKELVTHADIEDVNQMVVVTKPSIGTTALDGTDGDKNVVTDDETTIVDTVAYQNLVPGKEYVLNGTLYVKDTGEPLEVDGKPVTAQTVFTPETADGEVDVTFTFDSRSIGHKTELVAFESLERAGVELATHADIEDADQTTKVIHPTIGTTALDGVDGDKNVVTDDETTIVDTVEYKNVIPGKEYTVKGTLHVKGTDEDGNATDEVLLDAGGNPVTAETTFTPETTDGEVDVTFIFDARNIKDGTKVVVFESLEKSGVEIAAHADIEDADQTVTVIRPKVETKATDSVDGDKNIVTDDETTIVDTVEYKNLVPGKEYVLNGTLYVKDTGEPLEVNGEPVTAQTTFTPEEANGTVDVTFTFDSRNIGHKTELVAFESLERAGVELATHADIEDADQTTKVIHPTIGTTALDGVDGDKNVVTDDETTIVDTVEYKNVIPGKEYTVKGTIHVKKTDDDGNVTEEELLVDGKPVTAETTFTPEETKGTVDVTFTFDSRYIEDETDIVVFESLERSGVEIAAHADIEDADQTTKVTHPEVETKAADGHDGDKNVVTDGTTTIVDTVEYKNVIPGKEYTLKGTLHVKKTDSEGNVTDEVLLDAGGNPVTAETTFTPEETKGTVDVTFTFDATAVEDGTEMVAFESLEKSGVEIAVHADIEDEDQTTTARVTSIGTTATDGLDGDKTVIADAETTVTDSVEYENALTGTPYTMAGILMDADTGLPILTGDGSEKYTDADVADFMAKLLDVLGLSAENEEGYAEVPVSDETDGDAVKAQSVRVYTDGTYEVIDSVTGTDEDGLGFATVDSSGKVAYDDLTDEQKEAVSDVAVIEDAGVILDYSGTGELPADFDADALAQLFADNADLVSHMVCQTAEFTPEKDDGTVSMDFGFNANDVIDRLSGETKDIVVFEVMFKGSLGDEDGGNLTIVASECDLDSEEQTVVLTPSTIGTTAVDKSDGDHELLAGQDAVITDTVEYEGLIPGKEYTLKATLMDKETGEPLSVNDQHVTAELKFTPNSQSGSVDIDLGKFDASDLDSHDLVVFEELYKQTTDDEGTATDVLVAEHKDIEDEGQTVTVTTTPPGGFFGKTGGNTYFIVLAIAALVVLAGGCTVYAVKNRRSAKGGSADDAPAEADGNETDGTDGSEDSEA